VTAVIADEPWTLHRKRASSLSNSFTFDGVESTIPIGIKFFECALPNSKICLFLVGATQQRHRQARTEHPHKDGYYKFQADWFHHFYFLPN
jgi:hypothetical protein